MLRPKLDDGVTMLALRGEDRRCGCDCVPGREERFRHPYLRDGIRKILPLQLLGDEDFQLLKNGKKKMGIPHC